MERANLFLLNLAEISLISRISVKVVSHKPELALVLQVLLLLYVNVSETLYCIIICLEKILLQSLRVMNSVPTLALISYCQLATAYLCVLVAQTVHIS